MIYGCYELVYIIFKFKKIHVMKISKLYIHSFRGIPNELNVDFTNKHGKPMSVIIHGDNGSGKSSIIDAIEFNLQARIERSEVLKNLKRPSPICINNSSKVYHHSN